MSFQIAIDGPSGAGKSTIAKELAKKLGFIYVDTGAMYRTIGLYIFRKGIDFNNFEKIKNEMQNINIDIKFLNGKQHIYLNNEDVTEEIRVQEIADAASKVAVIDFVREYLVELQRKIAKTNKVIMDGRDIGTHVLRDADVKIYLTANPIARGERRKKELEEKGILADLDSIVEEIKERDFRDMNRKNSPLEKANDAFVLDTSDMEFEQVVEIILKKINTKRS